MLKAYLIVNRFFKKLIFYLTHYKCEVCSKWVNELYIYDYGIEASILGCKKCCNKKRMKILKFGNERCAPCRALNEFLKDNTPPNVEIISVTRETHPELFFKHGVKSIPLLIQIDEKGKEVKRWRKESFEFAIRHNNVLKEF